MKPYTRFVYILFLAAVAACGKPEVRRNEASSSQSSPRPLTIKGSDTMVILGQRFAEDFMKRHPGRVVQVNGGGSGTGIAALINGTADLAQSSRPMKDQERADVEKQTKSPVVETPVAIDALAVFVNGANRVNRLTIAQIGSIYAGRITNWSDVGGSNTPVVLYGRESSSGTYDYFREHVLNKADFAANVQTLQGTAAIINAVSRDVNGIGYGGIAYAKDVRAVSVGEGAAAVAPSAETVKNHSYPLSRKLFFYYPQDAPERVTSFVQWTLTPEAQSLVSGVGYFPIHSTP